ncbi:MAG: hypothetical protein ACHQAY_06720 [Hyphomicrobiales bacterium]
MTSDPAAARLRRDPTTGLERLALARLPTPSEAAPRLAETLRLSSLLVKHEDLSGDALGGNKPGRIDFIPAAAPQEGAAIAS